MFDVGTGRLVPIYQRRNAEPLVSAFHKICQLSKQLVKNLDDVFEDDDIMTSPSKTSRCW